MMSSIEPHTNPLKTVKRIDELLELQQFALEHIQEAMFLINSDARITYVNKAASTSLGYTKEELLSMSVFDLDPQFPPEIWQAHWKYLQKHKNVLIETQHRTKEGNIIHVEVNANYFDYNGVGYNMALARDITAKKSEEEIAHSNTEQLQEATTKLSTLFSSIPDMIWMKDNEGKYLSCNAAYEAFIGAKECEVIGKTDYDFYSCESADVCKQSDIEAMNAATLCISEECVNYRNNTIGIMEIRKAPIYNPSGVMIGVLGIGRDITERKRMEQKLADSEREFRALAEQTPDTIARYDHECVRLYANPSLAHAMGQNVEELLGKKPTAYFASAQALAYEEKIKEVIATGVQGVIEYTWPDATGRTQTSQIRIVPETTQEGVIRSVLATGRDITERKLFEKQIEFLAHHDALTGLPNRTLAQDRMEQAIVYAKRHQTQAALIFIDLDGFKTINDTLGHSIGDAMLQSVALRLQKRIRESDTLSRQGGDEFLLILPEINDSEDVRAIADKLIQAFEEPFGVHNQLLSVSASIGISLYPEHGDDFNTLLKNSDVAMYKAKESGKNTYRFYTTKMNRDIIDQFKIETDLKTALQNNEFILHYQPQIDLATHTISGVEALIRWNHPQQGMIPPLNFIPIAEESGLIVQIGQWVIEEACRQIAQWHKEGKELSVAVNISGVQFKRGDLESVVKNALRTSGINPSLLELELTESIMMHNVETTLQTVQSLKALGIQLSIDDFGTGYSSLAYLKRFAVDKLKIDQSFVRDILVDQEDTVIVQTIIQMAKNLNLKTIAEGVENKEVLKLIESYGCDEVQGYHFAKPLEAAAFENYYTAFSTTINS